jgi:hypothetical protein
MREGDFASSDAPALKQVQGIVEQKMLSLRKSLEPKPTKTPKTEGPTIVSCQDIIFSSPIAFLGVWTHKKVDLIPRSRLFPSPNFQLGNIIVSVE